MNAEGPCSSRLISSISSKRYYYYVEDYHSLHVILFFALRVRGSSNRFETVSLNSKTDLLQCARVIGLWLGSCACMLFCFRFPVASASVS